MTSQVSHCCFIVLILLATSAISAFSPQSTKKISGTNSNNNIIKEKDLPSSHSRRYLPFPSSSISSVERYTPLEARRRGAGGGGGQFTGVQRIESIKAGVVGLLAGGVALTIPAFFRDVIVYGGESEAVANGFAQWEFDTDMGSIECALFAIVYRYCVRDGEESNDMLKMGVVGAFAIVRTLSRIRIPTYCSFAPLDCGSPLGYFDWNTLGQASLSGLESAVMFGAAAAAIDYCHDREIILRFR